jgi:hypothetical protein
MFDDEEAAYELINYLLEEGALEVSGYDNESDTFTYMLTDKCKEIMPELYEEHFKYVNEVAFSLWNKGVIELYFNETGPMVMYKSDVDYSEVSKTLNEDERLFIQSMNRAYKGDII